MQGVDGAVRMPDFLDIIGASSQIRHRDFAIGIGSMRARHQRSASTVAVNPKLPAGQVLSIFRCFG